MVKEEICTFEWCFFTVGGILSVYNGDKIICLEINDISYCFQINDKYKIIISKDSSNNALDIMYL